MSTPIRYDLKFNNIESLLVMYHSIKSNVKTVELFLSKEESVVSVFDNLTSILYTTTPKEFSYISKEKVSKFEMEVSTTTETVVDTGLSEQELMFEGLDWNYLGDFEDYEELEEFENTNVITNVNTNVNTDEENPTLQNHIDKTNFELELTLPVDFLLAVYSLKECYINYFPDTKTVLLTSKNEDIRIKFVASKLKLHYDFYRDKIKDLRFEKFNLQKVKSFLKTTQSISEDNIVNVISIKDGRIYQSSDYMLVESSLKETAGSYLIDAKTLNIINKVKTSKSYDTLKIGALRRDSLEKLALCAYEDLLVITSISNKPMSYLFDKIDKDKIQPEFIISEQLISKLKFIGRFLDKGEDVKLEVEDGYCKLNQLQLEAYAVINNLSEHRLKITIDYFTLLNIIRMTNPGKPIKVSLYKLKENKYLGIFSSNVTTVVKLTGVTYEV